MKMILNRSTSIAIIDYNTPFCVIQEIMRCLGEDIEIHDIDGNLDMIIKYISDSKLEIELTDIYSADDLVKISVYISQVETNWDNDKLSVAFNHINGFKGDVPTDFTYGPKTNADPYSHDVTMLYIYCLKNNIHTRHDDTLEDLVIYVRLSFAQRSVLLDTLVRKFVHLNTFGIINMLKGINVSNNGRFECTDTAMRDIARIKNNSIHRNLFTDEEAVVESVRSFGIDITESSCPAREILQLFSSSKFVIEDDFTANYEVNPLYYDMTQFWKSELSHLYTGQMMTKLLNNECVNHNEITDPEQFLYEITLTKNIYQGVIPTLDCRETFIYKTPLDELDKRHLITFGILNTGNIIVLTPEEIYKFFRNHLDFRDFTSQGELISGRNMKKLTAICKQFPQEEEFKVLLNTISDIKTIGQVADGKMREFVAHAKKCDHDIKEKINTIFNLLFTLSMFMRGWEGRGDYPLAREKCSDYSERYEQIELRVQAGIEKVILAINALPDTTKIILKSLPLIKINEKDKSYYRNTNSEEGLTFNDRLILILKTPGSIYACLRLSSNYLASTAQYYNTLINNKSYFDIHTLDFIQ